MPDITRDHLGHSDHDDWSRLESDFALEDFDEDFDEDFAKEKYEDLVLHEKFDVESILRPS